MSRRAFTLIELLVVLVIISLVSAAVLPSVLPALQHRQISESARLVQAVIEGARDASVRANAPRGVRLLPDPAFPGSTTDATAPLAYSRLMPIEPAPDYSEGRVSIRATSADPPTYAGGRALRVEEAQVDGLGLPNARTSWYWNARVGDRIRIGGGGPFYTVAGPVADANPEGFVNVGAPGPVTTNPNEAGSEYLFLVNGLDDDGDGWIDEGFDGVDQDGDGATDEADEWEVETWTGPQQSAGATNAEYVIRRRPVPTQGARVVELPSGVVIDATTWGTTRERSRLPVDPSSLFAEIMVTPGGAVVPTTRCGVPTSGDVVPFLHLVLSERSDVHPAAAAGARRLPLPDGLAPGESATLRGDRRLVTINARSGNVTTNSMEDFDTPAPAPAVFDVNRPFYAAQMGSREAK